MYAVVIFNVDNSVAIVPVVWITEGTYVKWPKCSETTRRRLCRNCLSYEGLAKKLKVEIYGFAETFKSAEHIERKALSNSHFVSRDDTLAMCRRPRRTIHKRKRIIESPSSSSASSSKSDSSKGDNSSVMSLSEEEPIMPLAPPPPIASCSSQIMPHEPLLQSTMIPCDQQAASSTSNAKYQEHILSPVEKAHDLLACGIHKPLPQVAETMSPLFSMFRDMASNFREDMRRLVEVHQQMLNRITIIEAKVDRLMMQSSCRAMPETIGLPLPCRNITEFKKLDEKLNEKKNSEEFIQSLRQVPGATLGQFIRNALGRLVTNDLARLMNVSGQNGKFGWKGTKVLHLLIEFLNNEPRFIGFKTTELHLIIREWLHNSRKRTSIEVRRSEPKTRQHDPNVTM